MMEPGCKENTSMLVCSVLHTPEPRLHTQKIMMNATAGERRNNACEGSSSLQPGLFALQMQTGL